MDQDRIDDEEVLYRAVKKSYPDAYVDGKLTPALFINKKGCSVSRDGGRTEKDIITVFSNKFLDKDGNPDMGGCVKITAKKCRDADTFPLPKPTKKDSYHAEIYDSSSVVEISLMKAARLCAMCEEVSITIA